MADKAVVGDAHDRVGFRPERRMVLCALAGILYCAALVQAWLSGDLVLASLLVTACAALGLGGLSCAQDKETRGTTETPVDVPAVEGTLPSSLTFLSDPFAIPPPVLADMQVVQPFVDTLCGQIEGIQHEVAAGVVAVVESVGNINTLSTDQRRRIQASLAGADAIRDAAAVPGEIVDRLGGMLTERDRMISANFAGLQNLADEFQGLRGAVDVISQVADKAFFLSVNAAVEAHHQGRAGEAFGLIATEMRSLASQTAEGARQVGQSINAFADRMHAQLAAAMPGGNENGTLQMGALVQDLGEAQQTIVAAGRELDGVIQTLDAGHQEIVLSLSTILGNLQFQDVMRQRLEQIFGALRELDDLVARSSAGALPRRSLLDVLEAQRDLYVMESQRQVHDDVVCEDAAGTAPVERIELF